VYRIYEENIPQADLICLNDEVMDQNQPLTIFDPIQPWLRKTFTNYHLEAMLKPVFSKGKYVLDEPSLKTIAEYKKTSLDAFWPEIKRFYFPHKYHVDLSEKLWSIKNKLIEVLSSGS